jgi:hypothetical protein
VTGPYLICIGDEIFVTDDVAYVHAPRCSCARNVSDVLRRDHKGTLGTVHSAAGTPMPTLWVKKSPTFAYGDPFPPFVVPAFCPFCGEPYAEATSRAEIAKLDARIADLELQITAVAERISAIAADLITPGEIKDLAF